MTHRLINYLLVLRMQQRPITLVIDLLRTGLDSIETVHLLRPGNRIAGDVPFPASESRDRLCFGELGLAGEIRPVPYGEERLREAAKHGFERAIVPEANKPRRAIEGLQVIGVERLADALRSAF